MSEPVTPRLQDVAQRAGVSTATVSRCLNSPELVHPSTRERVLKIVEFLNYTPNFRGVALASNRTNTMGAVIPTMNNSIFAQGLQAFEQTLAKAGTTMLIASSNYNAEREEQQIKALIRRGADGLLLIGAERPASIYAFLQQRQVPYVLAWTYLADSPHYSVGFDNTKAAQSLAEHVLALGHQNIAMISGLTRDNDRAANRLTGVKKAFSEQLGNNQLPLIETKYSLEAGAQALEQILQQYPNTTALLCGNDVLAVGAIMAAKKRGLRVPQDISVVGFDDIELAQVIEPQLTTVHVPHVPMGQAAATMLLQCRDGLPGESIEFSTSIVTRGSLEDRR